MAIGGGRRRAYLFRLDPTGLIAIRIGNPLSWTAFFAIVVLFFTFLGKTALGWASLIAGAAVGMAVLGLTDRAIARAVATQPRDRVLKASMNVFLPAAAWTNAHLEEGRGFTFVDIPLDSTRARIAIREPRPPAAHALLAPLWENR